MVLGLLIDKMLTQIYGGNTYEGKTLLESLAFKAKTFLVFLLLSFVEYTTKHTALDTGVVLICTYSQKRANKDAFERHLWARALFCRENERVVVILT